MDIGLIVSFAGVIVAALAGVLGVWMERDPDTTNTSGILFSALIVLASGVELGNTLSSTQDAAKTDVQLATVLEAMAELAASGDNPALEQFVGAELAVQARANPEVVKKMEKSIAAKGGDPASVSKRAAAGRRMAAGLPADKPAKGVRPTLATGRTGGPAAAGALKARKAGKVAGAQDVAKGGGGRKPPTGGLAPGGAAGIGSAKTKAAAAADGAAGSARAKAAAAAGGAATRGKAAADDAAETVDAAATKAKAAATKATDDADKAKEDADKAAADAKKKKDEAKDKANDAAKAVKGLGS